MRSAVIKRSIVLGAHKTSVSLEDAFWSALKEIAWVQEFTLSGLISTIDAERHNANLSSAIRLFVLDYYRTMIDSAVGTQIGRVEISERTPAASAHLGPMVNGRSL